jgi:hypothetical protein
MIAHENGAVLFVVRMQDVAWQVLLRQWPCHSRTPRGCLARFDPYTHPII